MIFISHLSCMYAGDSIRWWIQPMWFVFLPECFFVMNLIHGMTTLSDEWWDAFGIVQSNSFFSGLSFRGRIRASWNWKILQKNLRNPSFFRYISKLYIYLCLFVLLFKMRVTRWQLSMGAIINAPTQFGVVCTLIAKSNEFHEQTEDLLLYELTHDIFVFLWTKIPYMYMLILFSKSVWFVKNNCLLMLLVFLLAGTHCACQAVVLIETGV